MRLESLKACAVPSTATHAGQAQKEVYVNECLARIDAISHCAVEAQAAIPPVSPQEGQAWLIAGSPTGAWAGQAGKIASFQQGQWLFQTPRDGLRIFNRMTGQELFYFGSWKAPARPALPAGGTVIDAQARSAIAALIDSLVSAGLLPVQ